MNTKGLECIAGKLANAEESKIDITSCGELAPGSAPVQGVGTTSIDALQILLGRDLTYEEQRAFESGKALCTGTCPDNGSISILVGNGIEIVRDVPALKVEEHTVWGVPAIWLNDKASSDLGLTPGASPPLSEDIPALGAATGIVSVLLVPDTTSKIDADVVNTISQSVFQDSVAGIQDSEIGSQAESLQRIRDAVNVASIVIFTLLLALLFQALAKPQTFRNKQLHELGATNLTRKTIDWWTNLFALAPAILLGFGFGWAISTLLTKQMIGAPLQMSLGAPIITTAIGIALTFAIPILHGYREVDAIR